MWAIEVFEVSSRWMACSSMGGFGRVWGISVVFLPFLLQINNLRVSRKSVVR